jgi:hypothetical protein
MLMRSALFWGITQRRVVILYHSTLRYTPEERKSQKEEKVTGVVTFGGGTAV